MLDCFQYKYKFYEAPDYEALAKRYLCPLTQEFEVKKYIYYPSISYGELLIWFLEDAFGNSDIYKGRQGDIRSNLVEVIYQYTAGYVVYRYATSEEVLIALKDNYFDCKVSDINSLQFINHENIMIYLGVSYTHKITKNEFTWIYDKLLYKLKNLQKRNNYERTQQITQ